VPQRISKSTKLPDLSLAHIPTPFPQGLDPDIVVIVLLEHVLNGISYWQRKREAELIFDVTSMTILATLCIRSGENGSLESCSIIRNRFSTFIELTSGSTIQRKRCPMELKCPKTLRTTEKMCPGHSLSRVLRIGFLMLSRAKRTELHKIAPNK
jgi:hypothetical protein